MDELLNALKPFAAFGGPQDGFRAYQDLGDDIVVFRESGVAITAGDVRKAREAIHNAARRARAHSHPQHPPACWCPYCGEPHSPNVRETDPRSADSAGAKP